MRGGIARGGSDGADRAPWNGGDCDLASGRGRRWKDQLHGNCTFHTIRLERCLPHISQRSDKCENPQNFHENMVVCGLRTDQEKSVLANTSKIQNEQKWDLEHKFQELGGERHQVHLYGHSRSGPSRKYYCNIKERKGGRIIAKLGNKKSIKEWPNRLCKNKSLLLNRRSWEASPGGSCCCSSVAIPDSRQSSLF